MRSEELERAILFLIKNNLLDKTKIAFNNRLTDKEKVEHLVALSGDME